MAFSVYNCSQYSSQEITVHNDYNNLDTKYFKINRVTKVRYLGLIFDCNMRWNCHVSFVNMRLRTILYKLYNLMRILSSAFIKIMYMSLYQSILQYGIIIWGGAPETSLTSLISLQNRAVRICLNKIDRVGSTKKNYKELGILPLKFLYKKKMLYLLF
jgi:hypothetical protein